MMKYCYPNILQTIKAPGLKKLNEWLYENRYRISKRLYYAIQYGKGLYNSDYEYLNQLTEANFKSIYGVGDKLYTEFREAIKQDYTIPQVRHMQFIGISTKCPTEVEYQEAQARGRQEELNRQCEINKILKETDDLTRLSGQQLEQYFKNKLDGQQNRK